MTILQIMALFGIFYFVGAIISMAVLRQDGKPIEIGVVWIPFLLVVLIKAIFVGFGHCWRYAFGGKA